MKRCPRCGQTYSDNDQNFCLNDGERLTDFSDGPPPTIFGDEPMGGFRDEAPTVVLDPAPATSPTGWQPGQPLTQWGSAEQGIRATDLGSAPAGESRDQTLPTISLVLGILGFVSVCCWGGIPFGAAALITGYLGMKNADRDPSRYGGRGMAVGGMVLGIMAFLSAFVFTLIGLLAR